MTDGPPRSAGPLLGIVVVNYGAHRLLEVNLAALQHHPRLRIVVVDNFHSPQERADVLRLAGPAGWEVVAPTANLGYGDGNNGGVARALEMGCRSVLLLNPDAQIDPHGCLELAALADLHQRSLISPVILRTDGSVWFSGAQVSSTSGRVARTQGPFVSRSGGWLTGAALVVHARMWRELGGFAPGYFMYWEDVDISRRCTDLGGTLMVATNVTAVHDAGGTQITRRAGKSGLYYRYNCRNRLLFGSRHMKTSDLLRWVLHTPVESYRILSRGGRRQFLATPWIVLPGVVGTAQGLGFVIRELAVRSLDGMRRLSSRARVTQP